MEPLPLVKGFVRLIAREGSRWTGNDTNGPLVPYGLDRLKTARQAGSIVLVEGESDCWTLWHHGFPALGIPGANFSKILEKDFLERIGNVYVLREPDSGGDQFVAGVADRL